MSNQKYVSITAHSKLMNVSTSEHFLCLSDIGWMERVYNSWTLTDIGKN